jgi:hypothetical protein
MLADKNAVIEDLREDRDRWRTLWSGARQVLASCSTWIVLVCGYSLPLYDHAITQLFSNAAAAIGTVARIILLDPNAKTLLDRWKAAAPEAEIHPLPGLPDALRDLAAC